jgi:hypothetical protein
VPCGIAVWLVGFQQLEAYQHLWIQQLWRVLT